MPDENGTEATRSDAPSVDDALFGDAPVADDKPTPVVDEEDTNGKDEQDPQGSDGAGNDKNAAEVEEQDSKTEAAEDEQATDEGEEEATTSDDLKVVVSIKGGRAIIGVQRPSADPHIETFDDGDLASLAQEVPAVTERARAKWEGQPKHPAYERPAPPARRRNRRQQGTAHDANAEGAAEQEPQQELRLF